MEATNNEVENRSMELSDAIVGGSAGCVVDGEDRVFSDDVW